MTSRSAGQVCEELRGLLAAATGGRWLVRSGPGEHDWQLAYAPGDGRIFRIASFDGWDNRENDARLVLAMRLALPNLLDEMDAKDAYIAELERSLSLHAAPPRSDPRAASYDLRAEGEQIRAAHPLRSGRHDLYAEAMRLVGERHEKAELVELVTWLLLRIDTLAERKKGGAR